MRIAIVNNWVPFVYGGAEFLADTLKEKLIEYGHEAMIFKIPFQWNPPERILENILACRNFSLDTAIIDRVIALKFPAYFIRHPNKIIWLIHQFRQVYDLWGTEYQDIPDTPEGNKIREMIINADNRFLNESLKIFSNSQVVADRLKKFNGFDSEVLCSPLKDYEKYYAGEYGDYFFYPSRISKAKRQFLAIEAMNYTKTNVKLIIAGRPDTFEDLKALKILVKKKSLQNKVKILENWISQKEKIELFANALGAIYLPFQEDTYGYVSFEACYCEKPIITCKDSGGVLGIMEDKVNGYVSSPDPKEIANVMDTIFLNKKMAKQMGKENKLKMDELNISWDNIINKLTA